MVVPPAITSQACNGYSPSPIPVGQLPAFFPPQHRPEVATLLDTEAIRQILALYPYIIDGRSFSALSDVFTSDAVANYSAPLGVLNGLSTIASTLESALASFEGTQHLLGTQSIRICDDNIAISITYYRAVHFLPQNGTGGVVGANDIIYAYGQYQDTWEKRDGLWRIVYRNLVYMAGIPGLCHAYILLISFRARSLLVLIDVAWLVSLPHVDILRTSASRSAKVYATSIEIIEGIGLRTFSTDQVSPVVRSAGRRSQALRFTMEAFPRRHLSNLSSNGANWQ